MGSRHLLWGTIGKRWLKTHEGNAGHGLHVHRGKHGNPSTAAGAVYHGPFVGEETGPRTQSVPVGTQQGFIRKGTVTAGGEQLSPAG